MLVFNFFQAIGFYGFASWVPTLLVSKGITITHSLMYSFVIAVSNPFGPLIGMAIADRIERKTLDRVVGTRHRRVRQPVRDANLARAC